VILVGEMRDLETIAAAMTAAETGHLVFATLHTNSATESINRIIDVFPPHQQAQIRAQLSMVLEAVVTQKLMPKRIGSGLVLASEVMICTPAIRALIRDNKVHEMYGILQVSRKFGMHTLNQSLMELAQAGIISADRAISASSVPDELERMLDRSSAKSPSTATAHKA
jgi:twitching motility protein PilT